MNCSILIENTAFVFILFDLMHSNGLCCFAKASEWSGLHTSNFTQTQNELNLCNVFE